MREIKEHNPYKRRAKSLNNSARIRKAPGRVTAGDLERVVTAHGLNCFYCNVEIDFNHSANHDIDWTGLAKPATFDHVIPLSQQGENRPVNLVPCCTRCNNKKGDRPADTISNYNPNW